MTFKTSMIWRFVDTCNLHNVAFGTAQWDDIFEECFKEEGAEFEFLPHLCSLDEDYAAELYTRGGGDAVRAANEKNKEIFLRQGGGDVILRDLETCEERKVFIRWQQQGDRMRWYAD